MRLGLKKRIRRGATLVEVIITTGVFSVLMLTLFSVVQYGMDSWRSIEGRQVTQTMMRKIGVFAMDDIRRGSLTAMGLIYLNGYNAEDKTVGVYGSNADRTTGLCDGKAHFGQALFLESAYNSQASPDAGGAAFFRRDADGNPQWSKTILYYAALMDNAEHIKKYGGSIKELCGGAASCPHKWLIRREIPTPLATGAEVLKYIEPAGMGLFNDSTGVKTQVLADCILAFHVAVQKPAVTLVIKSVRLEEMRRRLTSSQQKLGDGIKEQGGTTEDNKELSNRQALTKLDTLSSLAERESAYTIQYDITVIPNN
ncbi:hypothetical protein IJT93_05590 [bacterium]|nr:hypothetical protein [bacterium]